MILDPDKDLLWDAEDEAIVRAGSWSRIQGPRDKTAYAIRTESIKGRRRTILLHREIMQAPDGIDVDHINGNGLDNRRTNLRISEHQANTARRTSQNKNNRSGYRGVCWNRQKRGWIVQVGSGRRYLGCYADLDFAAALASTFRAVVLKIPEC